MKYRATYKSILPTYNKAWGALHTPFILNWTWEKIEKEFKEKHHATLIRSAETNFFEFIEFESEGDFVLFMLEWS
jgi:hypothetical protein